jgi:hypothetical protein
MISVSHLADPGLMCRHVRATGFKLALVVGYPSNNNSNKLRVSFWRANSAKWTLPALVDADELAHLTSDDHKKHDRTIKRAIKVAEDQGGWKVTL